VAALAPRAAFYGEGEVTGRVAIALCAAFALLVATVATGAGQFLYACGLAIGSHLRDACPVPIDWSASIAEADRGERLQRLIHAAEMTLAEKPPCAAPPVPDAGALQTIQRTYARGGERGMLEVFLAWKTYDDLDLIVYCPGGGSIGGGVNHPGSCGDGAVDLDANENLAKNVSSTPIEHAVWGHSIPEGAFRIGAYVYKVTDPDRGRTIPFTMIFKLGDEERACDGAVENFPRSAGRFTTDGKPVIARDLYIEWKRDDELPACSWREHEDPYCGDHACQIP
jgi:hypothetical protein